MNPRVVIIGGGVNGLVAACTLARAGLAPVVLERAEGVGGCVATDTWRRDVKVPTLSHVCGPLLPEILREVGERVLPQPLGGAGSTCALGEGGTALLVEHDDRAVDVARGMATPDSRRVVEFTATMGRLASVLRPLLVSPPPSVEAPGMTDLMSLLSAGARMRGLDRRDAHRLLRWVPMSVSDLSDEWFESEVLKALVCARAIFGKACGPMSAWTALELLMQTALTGRTIVTSYAVPGGPGAMTSALAAAATGLGAQIRTSARVARIEVDEGRATGVTLESGELVPADVVVSTLDPRTTFLSLVDSVWLGPEFAGHVARIRMSGVVAKVNLLLSAVPEFEGLNSATPELRGRALAGHLHVGPSRQLLERAHDATKYGRLAETPWLSVAIPTMVDPTLAPPGLHVMSVYVQGAPAALRDTSWAGERDRLGDTVVNTLAPHAPSLPGQILERQVITPQDLEQDYGLSGGHIFHGEHAVDQLFVCRPVYGWARYHTPVEGLFFCGAGAHPGGGVTGACGYLGAKQLLEALKTRPRTRR